MHCVALPDGHETDMTRSPQLRKLTIYHGWTSLIGELWFTLWLLRKGGKNAELAAS